MAKNYELSTKIYDELNAKGAGLGNASIYIIEKVLTDNLAAANTREAELREALGHSNVLLGYTDKHATFPNHAYAMIPRNIESQIARNKKLLTKAAK